MKFRSPFHRRRGPPPPTLREIGARVVGEHAQELLDDTRRVAEAISRGEIVVDDAPEGGPDYAGLVRRVREASLNRLTADLVMIELIERAQQAGLLRDLSAKYPGLLRQADTGDVRQPGADESGAAETGERKA